MEAEASTSDVSQQRESSEIERGDREGEGDRSASTATVEQEDSDSVRKLTQILGLLPANHPHRL